MTHVDIEPDKVSWGALRRALKDAADGRELFRDLERNWRAVANIAAADARRSARMIAAPRSRHEVSLRAAIAAGLRVHVSTGLKRKGRRTLGVGDAEVAIAYHRESMAKAARGKGASSVLWRAGWLLNRGRQWKHVGWIGRDSSGRLVRGETGLRVGIPQAKGWFDDSLQPHKPGLDLAVRQAYEEMLDRIERRSVR